MITYVISSGISSVKAEKGIFYSIFMAFVENYEDFLAGKQTDIQ